MKILGMDSSSRCRSVALCEAGDGTDGAFKVLASVGAASMRGGRFASLIDEVLSEAGCAVDEVDELALGVGPGSAAGIRSTLAFALGWEAASRARMTAFSSMWGLAAQARLQAIQGEVTGAVAGPARQLYVSRFRIESHSILQLEPLEQIGRLDLRGRVRARDHWIGPDVGLWFDQSDPSIPEKIPVRRTDLLPSGTSVAFLRHIECVEAEVKPEPIALGMARFAKAPPPRNIPDP